jgi:hypothetical protein
MKIADLLIKLGLNSSDYNRGMDDAKKKADGFGGTLKSLAKVAAGLFSVAAIVGFAKQVVQAGMESMRVERELGAVIRANGKNVEETLGKYKQFAAQLQKTTTIEDETTLGLIRLAEAMQSKAPQEAAKNAILLSKALGIEFTSALKMAVMAQSDVYTMLSRYAPALRTATTATEKATEYQKLLNAGLEVMNSEVNEATGKAQQLANAWGDIQEVWGTSVMQSKFLFNELEQLKDIMTVMFSDISGWKKFWAFMDITGNYMAKYADEIEKQSELTEAARRSEAGAADLVKNGWKGKTDVVKEHTLTIAELEQQIQDLKDGLKDYEITDQKAINETLNSIKVKERQLAIIQGTVEAIDYEKASVDALSDSMAKLKALTDGYVPPDFAPADAEKGAITGIISGNPLSDEIEETFNFNTAARVAELEAWEKFGQDLDNLITSGVISVVEEFGAAVSEVFSGDFNIKDFGARMLSAIGEFLSNFGKMLIAYGIAQEAFWSSLGMGPIGAGVAVAAGIALVAIGGAITGMGKKASSGNLSVASGSTMSSPSSGAMSQGTARGDSKVVFEIAGTNLKGVLNNVDRKYSIVR